MKVEIGQIWNAKVYDNLHRVEIIYIHKGEVTEVMDVLTHNQYFNDKDSNTHQFDLLGKIIEEDERK